MTTLARVLHYVEAKRRAGELAPKQSIVDALRPYRDDEAAFISFVSIPKLGVNPQSEFDTPKAIYAYPLREIWPLLEKNTIPFAGDRPFVAFFRVPRRADVIDVRHYSPQRFRADEATITQWLVDNFRRENAGPVMRRLLSMTANAVSPPSAYTSWAASVWPYPRTSVAHGGDDLGGSVRRVHTAWLDQHVAPMPEDVARAVAAWFRDIAYREAKLASNIARMWNFARLTARAFFALRLRAGQPHATMAGLWTALLREMGYSGFTDRTGRGLIHGNEPTQAFFLTPAIMQDVRFFDNIRPINPRALAPQATTLGQWYAHYKTLDVREQIILTLGLPDYIMGRSPFGGLQEKPDDYALRDIVGLAVEDLRSYLAASLLDPDQYPAGVRYLRSAVSFALRMADALKSPLVAHNPHREVIKAELAAIAGIGVAYESLQDPDLLATFDRWAQNHTQPVGRYLGDDVKDWVAARKGILDRSAARLAATGLDKHFIDKRAASSLVSVLHRRAQERLRKK